MPLRCLLSVFAALLLAASARAVTVRITGSDGSRIQASLHPGDVLRIDLPAEPVLGRTWSVRGHAPSQLSELGKAQRIFGGRMSNQGVSSHAWRAVAAGEGELTLVYGTATARAATPEKIVTLQLTVAGEPLGPEEAHPQPVSAMEQIATYERAQSCGDCSALTEQLALYRAPNESVFVLRSTYRDAPGGTLTNVITGEWTTTRGTTDPSATVYALADAGLFRLDGERLTPLDAQQIPLPGAAAFHKIEMQ